MQATIVSETLVLTYQTTRRYNPEDHIRNLHHRETFQISNFYWTLARNSESERLHSSSCFSSSTAMISATYLKEDKVRGRNHSAQFTLCKSMHLRMWGICVECYKHALKGFNVFVLHFTSLRWEGSMRLKFSLLLESSWNVMAHGDARAGKWRGNWRMEWVASTHHTTSEHGVSVITTADVHTSAASSRLNWRPCRFKWTRPFRRKTKSGFWACAITFQTQSTFSIRWKWRFL